MNIIVRLGCIFKDYYKEINPATLNGAIDVVVVRQEDGTFRSSPFHVRFGKLGVIRSKQKIVDIEINGESVDLHMKLGDAGEAFFVEQVSDDEEAEQEQVATHTNQQLNAVVTLEKPIKLNNSASMPSIILPAKTALTNEDLNEMIFQELDTTNTSNAIEIGNLIVSDCSNLIKTELQEVVVAAKDQLKPQTIKINSFSDGELTPELTSPITSRPPTPKSDTELEINKKRENETELKLASNDTVNQWDWPWGKLPERADQITPITPTTSAINTGANTTPVAIDTKKKFDESKDNSKKPGLLSDMLTFMSKKQANDLLNGVYLDDTQKLDSEVAALYINQKNNSYKLPQQQVQQPLPVKDEDQESGNGQSLPQSPLRDYSILGDIQISLCGLMNLTQQPSTVSEQSYEDLFQQYAVSFDRFLEEISTIVNNPNLVLKINNRYMNWQTSAPIVISAIVFHKQLPSEVINQLADTYMPPPKLNKSTIKSDKTTTTTTTAKVPAATTATTTTPTAESAKQVWRFWGSKKPTTSSSTPQTASTIASTTTATPITEDNDSENYTLADEIDASLQHVSEPLPTSIPDITVDPPSPALQTSSSSSKIKENNNKKKEKYRKTTRLSTDLIAKLNLRPGANEISYTVTTALQGTSRIDSYIFLWNYDDKIIVSDIDGTITKSDVWGHVLPMFGKDWSQAGVADLFTAIENNSYKFMYLSARAIGQSKVTRDLLRNINQDGFTLPEGPLLVTPASLFAAFHKEVIEKKPQEFKISCLEDIKSLFPKGRNPFYAGYGNRVNDVISYKSVDIPQSRIFTINPRGELKHEVSQTFQSSYSKLCDYVDQIFPPIKSSLNQTEYSTFNYWKDPLPSVQIDDPLVVVNPDTNANSSNSSGNKKKSKSSIKTTSSPVVCKPTTPTVPIEINNTKSTIVATKSTSTININKPTNTSNNVDIKNQIINSNNSDTSIECLSKSL